MSHDFFVRNGLFLGSLSPLDFIGIESRHYDCVVSWNKETDDLASGIPTLRERVGKRTVPVRALENRRERRRNCVLAAPRCFRRPLAGYASNSPPRRESACEPW